MQIELLAGVLDYLEEHLTENVNTKELARACYVSKSSLNKLFSSFGIGVHDYVTRRRMSKAAKQLIAAPELGILDIALQYGYSSNEAFTRAFKQIWNCTPSEYRRNGRISELFPRLNGPLEEGSKYMRERRNFDISELYDLFTERRDCYFVCCDIKNMICVNNISRRAGDMAIIEAMNRMYEASGIEDVVFRIGGDEFALLTDSNSIEYAQGIKSRLEATDGNTFEFEGQSIPLGLHVGITKLPDKSVRYYELFTELHTTIEKTRNKQGR